MAHVAFTEGDTEWGDHVTDVEYPRQTPSEASDSDG
jgi:hypothetical protein